MKFECGFGTKFCWSLWVHNLLLCFVFTHGLIYNYNKICLYFVFFFFSLSFIMGRTSAESRKVTGALKRVAMLCVPRVFIQHGEQDGPEFRACSDQLCARVLACVPPLGPGLNPREEENIPVILRGSSARFNLSECWGWGGVCALFCWSFRLVQVKFCKIHPSCTKVVKTTRVQLCGGGKSLEEASFLPCCSPDHRDSQAEGTRGVSKK